MLWKNVLFAAGIVGVARAQSQAPQSGAPSGADPAAASGAASGAPTDAGAGGEATQAMSSGMSMASGGAMSSGPMGAMSSGMSGMPSGMSTMSMMPVPSDLSGGFKTDQITLKIKFKKGGKKGGKKKGKKSKSMSSTGNEASTGTSSGPEASGTGKKKGGKKGKKGKGKLNMKDTMMTPEFALGKANGATPQTKWIIVMVDTTDQNKRMLHYVHSDFMIQQGGQMSSMMSGMMSGAMSQTMQQAAQQSGAMQSGAMPSGGMQMGGKGMKMKLNSTAQPQMPWKAPGMMGDMGGMRQYTFLMYSQQGDFAAKGMPQGGQPVDMKQFVSQNNLQPAVAGKSVMVDTSSNGTASSSGAPGATPAVEAAKGAASSLRSQMYGAGVVSAVFALGMALL